MAADLTERQLYRTATDLEAQGDEKRPRVSRRMSRALHDFLPNPPPATEGVPRSIAAERARAKELPWKARLEFFEWGFFTLNLGTGACTLLVGGIPFNFHAKEYIGYVFLAINCLIYIANITGMALKAYWHPLAFRRSFVMPGQALFFPTPFLAFASIFVSLLVFVHPHAGPELVDVLYVFFWIYVGASVLCAALLQWSMYDQNREFETITPSECLPIFPIMLAGTIGSALANALPVDDKRTVGVLIASYIFQGCGFWVAQLKLSTWISRNVLFGHPSDTRIMPIFFMAVGPPGYTAFSLLQLGSRAAEVFPVQGVLPRIPNAGDMVFAASWVLATFIFGQCLWFLLATSVIWAQVVWKSGRRVGWGMAWFATTFPLVGFFLAAGRLGVLIPSKFLRVVEVVGCFIVVIFWFFNTLVFLTSVIRGRLLVPPVAAPKWRRDQEHEAKRMLADGVIRLSPIPGSPSSSSVTG